MCACFGVLVQFDLDTGRVGDPRLPTVVAFHFPVSDFDPFAADRFDGFIKIIDLKTKMNDRGRTTVFDVLPVKDLYEITAAGIEIKAQFLPSAKKAERLFLFYHSAVKRFPCF